MALTPEETILKASKAVDEAFNRLTTPQETKKIAVAIKNQIVKRTRLGYGVDPETGRRKRLPKLSQSYIDQRKGKLSFFTLKEKKIIVPYEPGTAPKLASTTTPGRSNVTATGLLLNSLGALGGRARVGVFMKKVKYSIDLFGNSLKKSVFTTDVLKWLENGGKTGINKRGFRRPRVFLDLTRTEVKKIERDLGKRINDLALRLFNS